jgi:hypothetical protein
MAPVYAECMRMIAASLTLCLVLLTASKATAQAAAPLWTFAVSGDSRNCGDFVMPAIAAKVKGENDAFYWHLGDATGRDSAFRRKLSADCLGRLSGPTDQGVRIDPGISGTRES